MLTAARLRYLLDYDVVSGAFSWNVNRNGVKPNRPAGCFCAKRNVIAIGIDGKLYLAHRLAWLWTTGNWPKAHIDHINGDSSDNRIANLRDVPQEVNMQNRRKPAKHNASGLLGVYARDGRWRAEVRIKGKSVNLGRFDTKEEAHAAYLIAKRRLHIGCTI